MNIDLKSMSSADLKKHLAAVEKALSAAIKKEVGAARKAAEKAVAEFGLTLDDIAEAKAKPRIGRPAKAKKTGPKRKVAPKYKNPENPEQTWSGRGRRPDWVNKALAAGASLDDMSI